MKKQDIDFTGANLGEKCFEPLIKLYKKKVAEQTDFNRIKEQFYEELSEGQRALFMFYVFYKHVSKSHIEFFWWSAYLMAQPKSWSAIKAGIKYFKDESMHSLLEKIELELKRHHYPETLETFSIKREDLDQNKVLLASIKSLYSLFEHTSPLTIKKINNCIAKNLQEYVEIEA